VREQIRDAPLQPLGTSGDAQCGGVAPLQGPRAGSGCLERCGGSTVGRRWIDAQEIASAFGHRPLLENCYKHEVDPDEVGHDLAHIPLGAGSWCPPLGRIDLVDQVANSGRRTVETFEDR